MLPNFTWIIEGLLAGMAQPGTSFTDPLKDLEDLSKSGFSVLVTLTEQPIPFDMVIRSGLAPFHIPVDDFRAPTLEQAEKFCKILDRMEGERKKVAVHCYAGLGRTGTMITAYLIHRFGFEAGEAISRARQINPGYIQSDEQEIFLYEWAEYLKNRST